MNKLASLRNDLKFLTDNKKAQFLKRFFKTGKGEYGYGDEFIGVTVPKQRQLANKHKDLSLDEIENLLHSKIHEERLIALFILVGQFKDAQEIIRKQIFNFYLKNTKYINNWDLVDSSADKIVGEYLLDKKKDILIKLANSESIWERRIAIIATYQFLKMNPPASFLPRLPSGSEMKKDFKWTLIIAKILINDKHDLIQKAVGWMLREGGKRCSEDVLKKFLKRHYKNMPRVMLRYAIERFPKEKRLEYLKGGLI